jgi:hypothetical protein
MHWEWPSVWHLARTNGGALSSIRGTGTKRNIRHGTFPDPAPGSGEKFEPINTNPYLSIINRLFDEINRLFLEFLLEIEIFIENRSDISLKFFISTGYFQISTGYLITKPRFSPDIAPPIRGTSDVQYRQSCFLALYPAPRLNKSPCRHS